MSNRKLPHLPHIAKVIRPTVEETIKALHRLDQGNPPFSYSPAMNMAHSLYSGQITLQAALKKCAAIKNAIGAKSNAEVVKIMWQDAQKAQYFCHPLKDRSYAIRRDLIIPLRSRFYFIKDGIINIFWLQPWKDFELTEEQHGIIASIIRNVFVVDEFENAELYLLDTSAPEKHFPREAKVLQFKDLPMLSDAKLKIIFDRFALAYDAFVSTRKPKLVRPAQHIESQQGQLFS